MERARRILYIMYISVVLSGGVIALLFETDIMPAGIMADNADADFCARSVLELLALVCIPVSLKLFTTSRVRASLAREKAGALLRWGVARIALLGVPYVLCAVAYYLFMQTTFFYLALILLVCMVFIYPSAGRCRNEMGEEKR